MVREFDENSGKYPGTKGRRFIMSLGLKAMVGCLVLASTVSVASAAGLGVGVSAGRGGIGAGVSAGGIGVGAGVSAGRGGLGVGAGVSAGGVGVGAGVSAGNNGVGAAAGVSAGRTSAGVGASAGTGGIGASVGVGSNNGGTGGPTSPAAPGGVRNTPAAQSLANMSPSDITKTRKRCQFLMSSRNEANRDLKALCQLLRTASR